MESTRPGSSRSLRCAVVGRVGLLALLGASLAAQQSSPSPFVRTSTLLRPWRQAEPYLATVDFPSGRRMAGELGVGHGYPERDAVVPESVAFPLLSMDALASILQELGSVDASKLHALQGGEHQRVRELGVVLSARVGETVTHRFAGLDGTAVELRMTPRWAGLPATGSVGGRDFEYAPQWLDYRGYRSVDLDAAQWVELGAFEPDRLSFSESLERSRVAFWKAGPSEGAVAVGDAAVQLRLFQQARHAELSPVVVRVVAYDAAAGLEPAADGTMAAANRLASAEVATLSGSWVAATSYEEFSIVGDWDVEVAQGSRIGDPKVRRRAVGAALNLRCTNAGVEIEGELSTRGPIESRRMRIGQGKVGTASAKSSDAPSYVVPPEVVTIESVKRSRQPLQIRLPLRRDQPAVFRATTPFLPQGRELVVTAQRLDG